MRDIKFRAWDAIECKMIGWDRLLGFCDISFLFDYQNHGDIYHNIPMQYTGLKDKNGVEIYEGDIVAMRTEWNGWHCSDDFEEFETKGVVRIQGSRGAVITRARKHDLIECDGKWLKTWDVNLRACRTTVIGNIYENPELLGE